jgi:DNA-binding NarL/FixJ family response regulator
MRALESGAHGYLLKDTTATELEHARWRCATTNAT